MNRSLWLWGLLALLWVGGGTWYYTSNFCCVSAGSGATNPAKASSSFSLTGPGGFQTEATNTFSFLRNSAEPNIPSGMKASLSQLADYLGKHPGQSLSLHGQFDASEQYDGPAANLGQARAEALRSELVSLGVNPLSLLSKGSASPDLNFSQDTLYGGVDFAFPGLALEDGNFSTQSAQGINFPFSGAQADIPQGAAAALQQVSQYLQSNAGRRLALTGLYAGAEENPSAFPNLGLARAETLKDALVGMGAPMAQIHTASQRIDDMQFVDNRLPGGMWYLFGEMEGSEAAEDSLAARPPNPDSNTTEADPRAARIAELKAKLSIRPFMVYFENASPVIRNNPELEAYVKEVQAYLELVPEIQIDVSGHTSKTGTRAINEQLSQERARRVKNYLAQRGIPQNKIVIRSEVWDRPIAENATEAGQKQNRRVEIIPKQ